MGEKKSKSLQDLKAAEISGLKLGAYAVQNQIDGRRLYEAKRLGSHGIGFSNAIGHPKNRPQKALGRARRGPRSTQVWADSARDPGVWRLGAGELAGL